MTSVRDRIREMEAPRTVGTADGWSAAELGAPSYWAAMMDFDGWLALQSDPDSPLGRIFGGAGMAEERIRLLEEAGPDSPSDVALVFASKTVGILGHVADEGGVASHADAEILRWIADQANELRLTGQARIDYLRDQGAEALRTIYRDLEVVDYRAGERPSKRDYMARWYRGVDIDRDHATLLSVAHAQLELARTLERSRLQDREILIDFVARMLTAAPSEA
ncbi:hypothetical protein [Nisaea sp.]|uniref:hypothetical protein n=1 Tax=Nisaea sp. TaxID=2024842 RepID=UPI003B51D3E8